MIENNLNNAENHKLLQLYKEELKKNVVVLNN